MLSELSPQPKSQAPLASEEPVREAGLQNFVAEVLEASKTRLILVDFWAEWCGPCKQLGPVLEKLVRAQKGSVHLVKVDIDKNQQIAQQLGVQSIPAVFAFFQGQPIDGFMGALPESQIKAWLDRLIKSTGAPPGVDDGIGDAIKHADTILAAGDADGASEIYHQILELDPVHKMATAGLLRAMIAKGQLADAKTVLEGLPPDLAKDSALASVHTAIELAEQAGASGDIATLRAKVDASPADHQARFDLAMAYYAAGQHEEAVDRLLEIVRHARTWNEDAARKQLVKFFDAFGPTHALTIGGRKRLSSILFA